MRYTLLALIGALLAWVPAARASGPDSVVVRARLKEGDTLRYDFKAAFTSARGQSKDPDRLEQEGRLRLTVAAIDRDGNATVRVAFETLKARSHAGGKDMAYEPADHPAEGGESALAKMYAELATSILELEVSPEGSIEGVSGLEGALRAAKGAGLEPIQKAQQALGALSPAAIGATLSPIFALDRGGQQRKPGDAWTTVREIEVAPPYTALVEARYTLKSLSGGIAEASGTITTTLVAGRRPDAGPILGITDQSGSAAVRWDGNTSRLLSRTAEQRVAWTASLALKEPITSSATTTSRVELRAARDE